MAVRPDGPAAQSTCSSSTRPSLRPQAPFALGPQEVTQARVGVPDAADERSGRKIEHIAPERIALATVSIARGAIGIDADARIVGTARVFGFAQTGSSIRDALEAVLRIDCQSGPAGSTRTRAT